MKAFLYGWIRDIAFYTILMTVVTICCRRRARKNMSVFLWELC